MGAWGDGRRGADRQPCWRAGLSAETCKPLRRNGLSTLVITGFAKRKCFLSRCLPTLIAGENFWNCGQAATRKRPITGRSVSMVPGRAGREQFRFGRTKSTEMDGKVGLSKRMEGYGIDNFPASAAESDPISLAHAARRRSSPVVTGWNHRADMAVAHRSMYLGKRSAERGRGRGPEFSSAARLGGFRQASLDGSCRRGGGADRRPLDP